MTYHQALRDIFEDQLSLASIHYLRSHYQEAIDIYKRILLDNRQVDPAVTSYCSQLAIGSSPTEGPREISYDRLT